ncbi:MAG TPA: UDP-N-acetylmuramate--L-alanine ligase [Patescibacteria group bacterium]|nr:UDP-N-acetylmuramate--L-alanine ligase [Patescibacteria group bacterium]
MNKKKLHFVGIKGVGQTALAIIAKEAGFEVTGSDIEDEFITSECLKRAGIIPIVGFAKENIDNAELVITTGAHGGFDNVEVVEAKKRGIRVITKGEAVGMFMDGGIFGRSFHGISVAGSHGKTTLTAILATILKENKLDPSFLVGTGNIPSLGNPGHFGKGKHFVAEADEYATEPKYDKKAQFLWQHPKIEVFTNIELDHPDIYSSVDKVREAFGKFANQLPEDGLLVCGGDDEQIKILLRSYKGKSITYGFSPSCDFFLENVRVGEGQTFFWIKSKGISLGEFSIGVAGEHNALNALGALVVALELGLSVEAAKKAIAQFSGTKRRAEYKGSLKSGALVYDDYAHHPTEIQKTLRAFRQSFPKHKLICVFQPHTYSRTKELFEQFSRSFTDADIVILTDIFSSQREEKDDAVSSQLLAQNVSNFNKNVVFLPSLADVVEYVDKNNFGRNTVLITMGAGDVYKAGEKLIWKG